MKRNRFFRNIFFGFMAFGFKLRDMVIPPGEIIEAAGVERGMSVLDFGCGPGSYSIAAARRVGPGGRVYAIDALPIAVETVRRAAKTSKIDNIHTIRSKLETGLEDGGIDFVLLYDIVHELPDVNAVLKEIHRVLKPGGVLSASDHHLGGKKLAAVITSSGLFTERSEGGKVRNFNKKQR